MNRRVAQTLTMVLAGTCGVLLLLLLLLWAGFGRGYRWWSVEEANPSADKTRGLDRDQFKLPAWDAFAEVTTRPLFNEDRKPTPPMPPDLPPGPEQKPIPKLNVVLSGVIITPKLRVAMIKENGKQQSETVREGKSLPGDLSAWSLAQVKPRGVVFKNTAGEDVFVELTPVPNSQKPVPPAPPPQPALTPPAAPATADPQAAKAAEQTPGELQQRIEARRQQIREENERAKQAATPQQQ